ncbi:MAG: ABC transporter permease [Paludibacter sp.]|nr:ABC transporter permease [Bacteroidales bacterium]MCM1068489.1 ABC transporter permease [Prevotella sp.]MCM1353443.1 ABC transporter permease [Bacteroides sp.]MCM1442604.1 ABC transporter permease [Muribaculum sp.]MCM1481449.1 ABC transporter permease [Paludibacter sp.]
MLAEIWDSIARNRFRTAMTGFAVAWGIFILIVLLGASSGLQNGISRSFGNTISNSMEIWTGWTSMPYNGLKSGRYLQFSPKEAHLIQQLPEVDKFSAVCSYYGKEIAYNGNYSNITLKGVNGDYQDIMRKNIIAGRFINQLDDNQQAKVVVLDIRAVEEINNGNTNILGKYIKIGGINFRVIGICQKGERWEGATAHIPLSTHQAIYSPSKQFDHINLSLNGIETLEQYTLFENKVRQLLAGSMQFAPTDTQAVGTWSQMKGYEDQSKVMSAIRLFVLIIALCTLVSGAVGVSNIMLVSVKERTREIGIRKALGASPRTILLSIVGESLLITTLFGYIGMFAGIGLVELIDMLIPSTDDGPGAIFYQPSVDIPSVLTATLILVIVGAIAGFMPARKAVNIKPIEAMNADK